MCRKEALECKRKQTNKLSDKKKQWILRNVDVFVVLNIYLSQN